MSSGPEFSPPQIHRISAFLFFELWPRVLEKFPGKQSPLECLRLLMHGLAVCDYTAFPGRRNERTKQDVLRSFERYYDTSLEIAAETVKEKENWFSRKVDIFEENSDASGVELWSVILTRSDRNTRGDYWGSVQFQEFFENSYDLRISSIEETERFRNALKNTKRKIREAESRHRKTFEDLIIECAVEGESLNGGPGMGEEVRTRFNEDRPRRVADFLKDVFQAHSNAVSSMDSSKMAASLKRNRLRASLPPLLPPPPSRRESE